MQLTAVITFLLASLPFLTSAFYIPNQPGHGVAKKKFHIGNAISQGFENGMVKMKVQKRPSSRSVRSLSPI